MSKTKLYVLVDDNRQDVTTPYCFADDNDAKSFFIQNMIMENVPFDKSSIFIVGDFESKNVDGEVTFVLQPCIPKAIQITESDVEYVSSMLDLYHPSHSKLLQKENEFKKFVNDVDNLKNKIKDYLADINDGVVKTDLIRLLNGDVKL